MIEALSLGVLQPWGFVLLVPILAGLFYAYLRKKKLQPVIIPSLFLLKDLARPISTRTRFVPPWRFWFELLVLTLLLLCFVGLFHKAESRRYALIIDNSLSTAWRHNEKNILDDLKQSVSTTIMGMSNDAVFDLYQTSPDLIRVGERQMGASQVVSALKSVSPKYASEKIADYPSLVSQRDDYAGVVIFTDHDIQVESSNSEASGTRMLSAHVSKGDGAQARENIAISKIDFEADLDDETTGVLRIYIQSYAKGTHNLTLALEEIDREKKEWISPQYKKTEVSQGAEAVVTVPINRDRTEAIHAYIHDEEAIRDHNQLSLDDHGYISFQRENRIFYVVSARPPADLGIDKIRGIQFKYITPEQLSESISVSAAENFLYIDYVPPGLPDKNQVIISPPQGASGFEVAPVVGSAEVSEWSIGHPLLTYIDMASLRFTKFVPITPAVWSDPVITTNKGIVLIAGEQDKGRTVVAGFDLFPYRGKATPTVSVLFLNMLRWVSAKSSNAGFLRTYDYVLLPYDLKSLQFRGIENEVRQINSSSRDNRFQAEEPGLYFGETNKPARFMSAVNYFSDHESNPNPTSEAVSLPASTMKSEKFEHRISISDILIPIVLALLFADLLLAVLRNRNLAFWRRKLPLQ